MDCTMSHLRASGKKDITLSPIRPNAQLRKKYARAMQKLVANMSASYMWWVYARYRKALNANQRVGRLPDLAMDAAPPAGDADDLFKEFEKLRKYWSDHFSEVAKKLAEQTMEEWFKSNARA